MCKMRARAHTHTHARARTRTHTHISTHAHTLLINFFFITVVLRGVKPTARLRCINYVLFSTKPVAGSVRDFFNPFEATHVRTSQYTCLAFVCAMHRAPTLRLLHTFWIPCPHFHTRKLKINAVAMV